MRQGENDAVMKSKSAQGEDRGVCEGLKREEEKRQGRKKGERDRGKEFSHRKKDG